MLFQWFAKFLFSVIALIGVLDFHFTARRHYIVLIQNKIHFFIHPTNICCHVLGIAPYNTELDWQIPDLERYLKQALTDGGKNKSEGVSEGGSGAVFDGVVRQLRR